MISVLLKASIGDLKLQSVVLSNQHKFLVDHGIAFESVLVSLTLQFVDVDQHAERCLQDCVWLKREGFAPSGFCLSLSLSNDSVARPLRPLHACRGYAVYAGQLSSWCVDWCLAPFAYIYDLGSSVFS